MNLFYSNIIPRNKYIIVSDGIDQFILLGTRTSRKIIKNLLKKYTPA